MEVFEVFTPLGVVSVTFPESEDESPRVTGDAMAKGYFSDCLDDIHGPDTMPLSFDRLTPRALVECCQVDGMTVNAPRSYHADADAIEAELGHRVQASDRLLTAEQYEQVAGT